MESRLRRAIRHWYSLYRVLILRLHGARIGKNVTIGFGVHIKASDIVIEDKVFIDDRVSIQCSTLSLGFNSIIYHDSTIFVLGTFKLGNRCKISRSCIFKGNNIVIGNELWCNEFVEVGGGGWEKPSANLFIGDRMHIGKNAHINVCQDVIFEGDSGFGMDCMVFTHSSGQGQSQLDGFPFSEGAVRIGKHVSVFSRVIIGPGVTVEKGTTIGANSVVLSSTNPDTIVAGTPAKERKKILPLDNEAKHHIIHEILVSEYPDGNLTEGYFAIEQQDHGLIYYASNIDSAAEEMFRKYGNTIVVLFFTFSAPKQNPHVCYIDLSHSTITGPTSRASEAIRDHLRRRGLRLRPVEYLPYELNAYYFRDRGIEL